MSIIEVSLLTGFYPNQNDLKQVRSHLSPLEQAGDALATSHTLHVGTVVKAPRLMPHGQ